jgi:5-hydroxyisourate hydrolase-like protein (transthyretin family)
MSSRRRRLLGIALASVAMAGASCPADVAAQSGGSLEVHALDATIGKPAEGIVVDLFLVSTEPALKVGQMATNAGGQATLIAGGPLKVGRYELRFAVGDYFRRQGLALGTPSFLEIVPIRIYLSDPDGRYHVPAVFTPWSYTMHG